MKKTLALSLIIFVAVLLAVGCASTTSSSEKLLSDTAAAVNADTAASLAQTINKSMATWAQTGTVSGTVVSSEVKAAALGDFSVVTGPDTNSYYHVTEEVSTTSGTYEVDLHVKLVKDGSDQVTDTYIYGTLSLSAIVGTSNFSYTMTFGSGVSDPYHGTATWSGADLASIGASGPLSLSITTNDGTTTHTTGLTLIMSSFSLSVTSGADYPTGTISITLTYDETADSNTYTITFNGTNTATVTYGTDTTTITLLST
ncbi:hypothetical protein COT42_07745 [Candidatus Saganbacteria bacterium CG08_land_8_20_14_0_20_45_16]|uniref:Uncharacterized protein n=1 Tax=Candidatus Saganbacteria bacterium CG08_land_8_20_14_0_20_45_16 TaxID=2014293 RepID=A0A2H0XUA7_UNCSA|nr:MAG: hypothetical protein COT42_07745 [Candidatus Saganbacteria bacterium CG08_land_8_20_14_0_20_45_16]